MGSVLALSIQALVHPSCVHGPQFQAKLSPYLLYVMALSAANLVKPKPLVLASIDMSGTPKQILSIVHEDTT